MRTPSKLLIYFAIFLLGVPLQAVPGPPCPIPMFSAARGYSTGGNSVWFVATGDFNNDNQPDAVLANFSSGTISVLLGNGDGTMQPPLIDTVGFDPNWIATADFNNDGKLDIAVASNGCSPCASGQLPGGVYILLGNGNGTFKTASSVRTGIAFTLSATDLNGDGKPDLIVDAGILLLGKGDGTFQAQIAIPDSAGSGSASAFGDFNKDGKLDVVTADVSNGNLTVALGNGSGGFTSTKNSGSQSGFDGFQFLAAQDFDNDGKLDVVGLASLSNYIDVWMGNGDGTFKAAVKYTVGSQPTSVTIGDFNRDGSPDLALVVASNGINPFVGIMPGSGNGTFSNPVAYIPTGQAIKTIAQADFNGDGKIDLAVSSQSDGLFTILGNGDGTFQTAPVYSTGNNPQTAAAGDLNNDGIPDIVVANNGSNDVGVLIGKGAGQFKASVQYAAGAGATGVALADFDGDSKLDIVVGNLAGSSMSVFLNNGDGTFKAKKDTALMFGGAYLTTGDFNKDGKQDVAVMGLLGTTLLLGKGDGTFQAPATVGSGTAFIGNLVAADLNRDGNLDLVAANNATNTVSVMLGNGNGTFKSLVNYNADTNKSVQTVAAGDMNADGIPDLVVGTFGCNNCNQTGTRGTVAVMLGKGDGTFGAAVPYIMPNQVQTVTLADFNGDGALDAAVSNFIAEGVDIMLNNGDGTLGLPQAFGAQNGTLFALAADLNGDTKPDLVALNGASNSTSVLLNNCACTGATCYGISGVVHGATFLTGFAPGQWVSIEGKGLSTGAPQILNFVGGAYPTSANNLSVSIGGQLAPLWYLSPTSLNVISPDLSGTGQVDVVVTNNGVPTPTVKGQLQQYAPAFFLWPGGYVVATDTNFGYKVKDGTFPGFPTTPTKPGDPIILWGTGFGATNPPVAAGHQVPSDQIYSVAASVQVTIGGVQAQFIAAAMASGFAALTQVAVYVPPNLANGDYPVVVTVGGVPSTNSMMLTVHN